MNARAIVSIIALTLGSISLAACEELPPPATPQQATDAPTATPPAAPPDPATVTDGDVTVAWANGMQILVKRIPGADMAASQLYIRGGVRNWTAETAGIEGVALGVAATGGTESIDKDAFARRLAALGGDIGSASGNDYGMLHAKAPLAAWDDTFAMLADVFLHPALPASEIEVRRQRQISMIRHEKETADEELHVMVHEAAFSSHPYARRSVGTVEAVSALNEAALRAHLGKLREAGRLLLVVVGDLDPAHVIEAAKKAFGGLPRGSYDASPLPKVAFPKANVIARDKKLATNYIQGIFPVPSMNEADFAAGVVAMNVLSYRFFEEVRTKRNLSYAVSAHVGQGTEVPLGALYVTAVDPNTTIKVMLDQVTRLKNEPVPEKELNGTKATYLTGHLMRNESTDGQASLLASAVLMGGDWKLSRTLPDRIKAITAAEVQGFAKKYVEHLQMVVLGDTQKIDKGLFGSM